MLSNKDINFNDETQVLRINGEKHPIGEAIAAKIGDLTETGLTGDSVAEQLFNLNEDLKLEKFTPSLVAALGTPNVYEHNCFYNPKTKSVHIQVVIYSADALIPVNSATIFTVDDKYRPASNLQLGMAFVIGSAQWDAKQIRMEKCFMGANGAFGLNNFIYGDQPTKILYIEGDYIAK